MGRASTRQNKTPYQLAREELGLSRERAAELLETIPAERIERIESERSLPRPDEVLRMAQRYKKPSLCNAYCARACPIGQEYVPEIKPKELPAIVLEMLATLNTAASSTSRPMAASIRTSWRISCASSGSWSRSPGPWRPCSSGRKK